MNEVSVLIYGKYALKRGTTELSKYPLVRRMGDLQKSVVTFVEQLRRDQPETMATLLDDKGASLHFATAGGEIKSLTAISENIIDRSLPVSPKEFQHSVHNASIAYVAMVEKINNPTFVTSCGFLSGAKALYYSASRIASGLDEKALLIHAEEYDDPQSDIVAEVEVVGLAKMSCQGVFSLKFARETDFSGLTNTRARILAEGDVPVCWLDLDCLGPNGLMAASNSGESIFFCKNAE
ncbi:MAG: beta-ketoacyl synthase chain length factor [Oligoflexales bacterium]